MQGSFKQQCLWSLPHHALSIQWLVRSGTKTRDTLTMLFLTWPRYFSLNYPGEVIKQVSWAASFLVSSPAQALGRGLSSGILMRFHIYLPAEEAVSLATAFHAAAAFSVLLHYLHSAKVLAKTNISFLSSYEDLDFRGYVLCYTQQGCSWVLTSSEQARLFTCGEEPCPCFPIAADLLLLEG